MHLIEVMWRSSRGGRRSAAEVVAAAAAAAAATASAGLAGMDRGREGGGENASCTATTLNSCRRTWRLVEMFRRRGEGRGREAVDEWYEMLGCTKRKEERKEGENNAPGWFVRPSVPALKDEVAFGNDAFPSSASSFSSACLLLSLSFPHSGTHNE